MPKIQPGPTHSKDLIGDLNKLLHHNQDDKINSLKLYPLDKTIDPKKVKALLIGNDYVGTPYELSGCVPDIQKTYAELIKAGVPLENITIISDAWDKANDFPSRDNIINASKKLVNGAMPGDFIFTHYSGHGGDAPDSSGDEKDGQDETICPVTGDDIKDDELCRVFSKLNSQARSFNMFDSCHSGTVLDLSNNLDGEGGRKPVPGQPLPGSTVSISGCRDKQTSADFGTNGAMTIAFYKSYAKSGLTFLQFLGSFFHPQHQLDNLKSINNDMNQNLKEEKCTQRSNIAYGGVSVSEYASKAKSEPATVSGIHVNGYFLRNQTRGIPSTAAVTSTQPLYHTDLDSKKRARF